jgi:predicted RNA-binding Zn ribbon-like protein
MRNPTGTTAPLFLAGHSAIDFLNTAFGPDGAPMEAIADGRAFLGWIVGADLLKQDVANRLAERLGSRAIDSAAAEARKLRERTRIWLERWRAAPQRNYSTEINALNKVLARGKWRREVIADAEGLSLVEQLDVEGAGMLLALVAWQIALLVTHEDPSLIKQCAGPDCTLWFLDRTKARHRRFCSAAVCGNRAKVAAFRERQRQ